MNYQPYQEVYMSTLVKRAGTTYRFLIYRGKEANGLISMEENGIAICVDDKVKGKKAVVLDRHFADKAYPDQQQEYLRLLIMSDEVFVKFVNLHPARRFRIGDEI